MNTQQKASIAPILEILRDTKPLNKSYLDIALYYIPKPSRTLEEIIDASVHQGGQKSSHPSILAEALHHLKTKGIQIVSNKILNNPTTNYSIAIKIANSNHSIIISGD